MAEDRILNLTEYWRNRISDSLERYEDCISFNSMPKDEFIEECLKTITYYYDNEMLGESLSMNFDDLVSDTAKAHELWRD